MREEREREREWERRQLCIFRLDVEVALFWLRCSRTTLTLTTTTTLQKNDVREKTCIFTDFPLSLSVCVCVSPTFWSLHIFFTRLAAVEHSLSLITPTFSPSTPSCSPFPLLFLSLSSLYNISSLSCKLSLLSSPSFIHLLSPLSLFLCLSLSLSLSLPLSPTPSHQL